jgi:uncharacterized membrane protein
MAAVDERLAAAELAAAPSPAQRLGWSGIGARPLVRLRALTRAERVAYGAAALGGVLFSLAAVVHHLAFQNGRFDLGFMVQVVWNTAHGRFLLAGIPNGVQVSEFASHVDPFLALLVPFWWAWPSPLMLLVFQALAVSLGALPVFWLARKHLASDRAAACFAVAYLLYPATQFNAVTVGGDTGFHPVSVAIPLLLLAIWFLDEDRLAAFTLAAVLAASTKEEMPLVVGLLGIWYAHRKRRWRFGGSVFVVGLALTLFDFLVVIPHYAGTGSIYEGWYTNVGGTPTGILRTAVTDPMVIVHAVATTHKGIYLLFVFGPFLFLWALEPLLMLAAVPDLAINLLGDKWWLTDITYPRHYTATLVPIIVVASIYGLSRFRQQAHRLALYVLPVVLIMGVLYSPLWRSLSVLPQAFASNSVHRAKAEALALIPRGAPVSASNQLGAQLSERRQITLFPIVGHFARWVVIDEADPLVDRGPYLRAIERLRRDSRWRLVYASHRILVFHSRTGTSHGA